MSMCECGGQYASKFGYVGVSGTPSTGKCGGVCEGRGKPLDVCEDYIELTERGNGIPLPLGVRDAGPPIGTYKVTEGARGGRGERAGERAYLVTAPYEVLLEHIRGLVEDVAELKEQIAAMSKSRNGTHWCDTHMSWEHGRGEPDYMPEDYRPGR